eukprot:3432018-Amphidinium_carterae.2
MERITIVRFRVNVSVAAGCPLATAQAALHVAMMTVHPTVRLLGVVNGLQLQHTGSHTLVAGEEFMVGLPLSLIFGGHGQREPYDDDDTQLRRSMQYAAEPSVFLISG